MCLFSIEMLRGIKNGKEHLTTMKMAVIMPKMV